MLLAILFFVTAALYSSVGFGGGSTYLALLLIWEVPYFIFPVIALSCNIIVVSGNCFNYIRAGNINLKFLSPYLLGSIPLAYIGGSLSIEKELFEILLFLVLTIAGILLLTNFKSYNDREKRYRKIPTLISILIEGSSFPTFFKTSISFGKSADFSASIDLVTTGSNMCFIDSKGSISFLETVSPANTPLSPEIPTIFPPITSSI